MVFECWGVWLRKRILHGTGHGFLLRCIAQFAYMTMQHHPHCSLDGVAVLMGLGAQRDPACNQLPPIQCL
jgi:hypothetical protein